jgi:uncharacterized protein (DUF362 family)
MIRTPLATNWAASTISESAFLSAYVRHWRRPARSRVAIVPTWSYSTALEKLLWEAVKLFDLDVRGKSILLKPNLVDYIDEVEINTHPLVVGAAVECFRRLGAAKVTVGEGPGHQRDTNLLLYETGLGAILKELAVPFIDLNRDDLVKVRLKVNCSGLKEIWFPQTVMNTDFIVSMPKVKTHHWSGVTLSLKNLFGVVPGSKYGWPKNVLHWRGIDRCIIDIAATVPVHFVIADAIVCMEGNGPLAGTARRLDTLLLADDPVTADATCARLMGLRPEAIRHIRLAAQFLGNTDIQRIDQLGCALSVPAVSFSVVPEFEYLRGSTA